MILLNEKKLSPIEFCPQPITWSTMDEWLHELSRYELYY